jgi:hypothetical protein
MVTLPKQTSNINKIIDARYEPGKHQNQQVIRCAERIKKHSKPGDIEPTDNTPKRERKCPQNHKETGDIGPEMTTRNRF